MGLNQAQSEFILGAAAVGAWVVTELCSRINGIVWLKLQVTRLAR